MSSSMLSKRSSTTCVRRALQVLGGILGVFLLCFPTFSQGSFGRILGTVTDTGGGVVPGATVTVLDTERGVARTLTTDDAGAYNAPNLTPGTYTVRAEAKGFKRLDRQNVVVEVGREVRVDLTVQPGEQDQTITVTESVPLVETTNATMGGTLENADIIDLPLNGRDYQNLLGLRPGVMLQPGGGPWTQSSNNVRPDESVWLVEGVINANFFDARPVINMPSPFTDGATILPVDAIQEFNLMENPKAEYGWKTGAQVNVGIKSGTNTLHGDAYAFGRYQGWDARNYFNIAAPSSGCPLTSCDQTPAQLTQFGVVGGPIKKDKLFFFAGYEGLRSFIGFVGGLPAPATASQANIGGNGPAGSPGSSMVDAINALQAAGVPRSIVSENLAGCTGDPHPLSPGKTAITCTGNIFPNVGTSNSFLSTFPTTNTSDNGVGKLDYHLNDKNTINGMFFYGHYNSSGEDHPFANVLATDYAPIRATTITSNWVYTPNSNVVNEARFGYDRATFDFVNIDVNTPATTYGLNTGVTNPLAGGLPSITITPFGNGGTPIVGTSFNRPQYFTPNPYFDIQDAVSLLRGKHSIKIGAEFAHMEADAQVFNNGRGRFDFSSLQKFFAGSLNDAKLLSGQALSKLTYMNFAGFIQDDWRVTPKLILNLGLRYMYLTPMKDANNNLGNFDPGSPSGLVQQGQAGVSTIYRGDPHDFEPRVGFAWDLKGNGKTVVRAAVGLIHETWTLETFEGQFSFQNNNSTAPNSVPTGASLSCQSPNLVPSISCPPSGGGTITLGSAVFTPSQTCWDPTVNTCPASQSTMLPTTAGAPVCGDGATFTNPVTQLTTTAPSPCDIFAVDPNLRLPYVVNYNFGITHAFTNNLSLEIEYVGNHGYRLLNFADINQAPLGAAYCLNNLTPTQVADACGPNRTVSFPTTTSPSTALCTVLPVAANNCQANGQATQEARPYFARFPYIGFINSVTNRSYSAYNSLQVTLTQRLSHGLLFNLGYTYGHGLDSGSLNRFGLNPQNSVNSVAGEYGSGDFDVRHRFTATATYNIPGIKGYGQLLEGWQINTIVTIASPQPWQIYDPADNFSGTNENADRWNIFGNPADFPSGKNSINDCTVNQPAPPSSGPALPLLPFAVGNVSCTVTSIYGGVTTPATAAQVNGCLNHSATSGAVGTPLDLAGCYISANGISYITPQAFGAFGNMGRNILRDSGYKNWDLSIFKNFTFKEHYNIQARWEVFNVLNHPIAANPYGASSAVLTNNSPGPNAVFGASMLTPDFAAGNPLIGSGSQRVMQVGLKIGF